MTTPYSNTEYHAYPPNLKNNMKDATRSPVNDEYAANADDARRISRTPSPTPSEAKELKSGAFDWPRLLSWRFWIRKDWIWWYLALAILATLTALMTIYHEEIVEWLEPAAEWMHEISFGWLIPIGVTIVLSFPPLFGQEIVGVLCGLVWGLWIGFAIFAGGTLLGEIANFYAFKYCCRSTGEKWERTQITYACLARVVREGGFKIVLAARLSAIPGHFSTAVCSVCGTHVVSFTIATILSLPKQFITVYLGVMIRDAGEGKDNTKSTIINAVVLVLTFIITAVAMWYIYDQMNKVKPSVIYARRKARQEKLERAMTDNSPYPIGGGAAAGTTSQIFNPRSSDSDVPLTHQQWDNQGKAMGYSYDPRLEQPQPRPMSGRFQNEPRNSVDVSWDTRQAGAGHAGGGQGYGGDGVAPYAPPARGSYPPSQAYPPHVGQYASRSPPPQSQSPRQYGQPRSPRSPPPPQGYAQSRSPPPQAQGYAAQSRSPSRQGYAQSRSPPPQGYAQSRSPPPQGQGYYPQQRRQSQQYHQSPTASNNPYSPSRTNFQIPNPRRTSVDVGQTPTQAQFSSPTGPPSYTSHARGSQPSSPIVGQNPNMMPMAAMPPSSPTRAMSPNNPFAQQQHQQQQQHRQQQQGFSYHVEEPTDMTTASYHTALPHH